MWQPQSIYSQFLLRTPILLQGEEAIRGLYNYPSARLAVIHGNSFQDRSLFEETFKKKDIQFFYKSWRGEPDLEGLSQTVHELEAYRPDTIIAIGGGSVIDGSKLCRIFYEFPYFEQGITRIDSSMLQTNFIAIPTTIGSGAEVSSAAVYIDTNHYRKEMVVIHDLQPDAVVYDERYVKNAPLKLLGSSALDAMSHMLEGYVSNVENHIAEAMAEEGLRLLSAELRKLVAGETDNMDYQRLQYAGYLGGIVQNHCIVGAAHAVAHQLNRYGYSHGEAITLLLPAVIRMNARDKVSREKYDKAASLSGFKNIDEVIRFVETIGELCGIHYRLKELRELLFSLETDEIFLVNVQNDKGGKGNPVTITEDYIRELIRRI